MNLYCRNYANVKPQRWVEPSCARRVAVEHSLAQIGQWQSDRARYIGTRKNLFHLRRMAVVHNLHVIARMPELTLEEAA